MSKYRKMLWKLKYAFHYYFGKEPWVNQCGGFSTITDVIDDDLSKELKCLFTDQICETALYIKAEIVSKVSLIVTDSVPGDPLAQRSTAAWKCMFKVHTRKSWKEHQRTILQSQVKWRE